MIEENQQKSAIEEFSPYKGREYEVFLVWSTLPMGLKKLDESKLREMGFDTEDELFNKLIGIKTRTGFAKEFGLNRDTLRGWENREDFKKRRHEMINDAMLAYKKDIDFHFTRKTIASGNPIAFKIWKEYFENWQQKIKVDVDTSELREIINKAEKIINDNGGKDKSDSGDEAESNMGN